jgi:hypothetical protein
MQETCLFEIMELPELTLKKALPKASARVIARLLSAYPRTVGRTFLSILSECLSRPTIEFLQEEVNVSELPSFPQIRLAEAELMKLIRDEERTSSPPLTI